MTVRAVLMTLLSYVTCLVTCAAMADQYGVDQNWSAKDLAYWRNTSQGSRLVPLSWLMALEMKDSKVPFMSDANMRGFGYTPGVLSFDYRTYPLPRGFVIDLNDGRGLTFSSIRWRSDQSNQEPWVGLNCAACHTANISYEGYTWEIQGGPTNADFQRFLEGFRGAISETRSNQGKFNRFAAKVLVDADNENNRRLLTDALSTLDLFLIKSGALNHTDLEYGPGRVDAVGHILNRVAQLNGAQNPKANPSDAPVSYPFVWNTPQHDKVQWNGVAPNQKITKDGLDVGALARNASEVIGVFGDVAFQSNTFLKGFPSSVQVNNLDVFERLLMRLKPPKWPERLGAIDATKVKSGARIFAQNCASCHAPLSRDDLSSKITARMATIDADNESQQSITTDPWMACNAVQFISNPGRLEGAHLNALTGKVTDRSPLVTQLGVAAREVLFNQKGTIAQLALLDFLNIEPVPSPVTVTKTFALSWSFQSERERRLNACYALAADIKKYPTLAYKARPLNGIWATSPYLHNGSVRTLYELLIQPKDRRTTFKVGSTTFDPKDVGFIDAYGSDSTFTFDTALQGNSNLGHDYGASSFTDDDRYALIEYMKSL